MQLLLDFFAPPLSYGSERKRANVRLNLFFFPTPDDLVCRFFFCRVRGGRGRATFAINQFEINRCYRSKLFKLKKTQKVDNFVVGLLNFFNEGLLYYIHM